MQKQDGKEQNRTVFFEQLHKKEDWVINGTFLNQNAGDGAFITIGMSYIIGEGLLLPHVEPGQRVISAMVGREQDPGKEQPETLSDRPLFRFFHWYRGHPDTGIGLV